MRRSKLVLSVAIAAALVTPGAASAATVQVTGNGELLFIAVAGEDNELSIHDSAGDIVVRDYNAPVAPVGGGCVVSGDDIRCPLIGTDSVHVAAGNGENYVDVFVPLPTTIDGSSASKNVFNKGDAGTADLEGGPGPDQLRGGSGTNLLFGGGGDDTLLASQGVDLFHGGEGIDVASYQASLAFPVKVTIDDVANDGQAGDVDNVHTDVENIWGGARGDDLRGSSGPNLIDGGWGDDTIRGGGGDDVLRGDDDADELRGESGDDDLLGEDGDDHLDGGFDDDELFGAAGSDELAGGFGNDSLRGGDDADKLLGGRDADVLQGQNGPDTLEGNAGGDTLAGGADSDTVLYANYSTPISVDLDGSPSDDGIAGEGDTVGADVENVEGGAGDDTITGNASTNRLAGYGGNDTIDGGAGPDTLLGAGGQDTIAAQDGEVDAIDCGGDFGTLTIDANDTIAECPFPPAPTPPTPTPTPEQPGGNQPAAPGGGGAPAAPGARPALTIGPAAVRLTRKRIASLKLSCSSTAATSCTGTLRLTMKKKGKTVVVGKAAYSVAPGTSRVVKIRVSKTTARKIGRKGLKVTAEAVTRDAASKRTITLRKAR